MSLLSRLLDAARSGEAAVEFRGNDPSEPVALAGRIGAREGRAAECAVPPDRSGALVVRFGPPVRPA